jgi:hypothetical protein
MIHLFLKTRLLLIFVTSLLGTIFCHAETAPKQPSSFFKHPVLEQWKKSVAEGSKAPKKESKSVKELMALTEAQVLALIPDQPPTISDLCPVCARKNKPGPILESVKPFAVEFDPLSPDKITCKKCGTIYPNVDFPLKTEAFQNMLGEEVKVRYYTDEQLTPTIKEKVAKKPHRLYLLGLVDNARWSWLSPRVKELAGLYQSTRDERYAKRLILVLDELAKRYPHYLLTTDYGLRYVTTKGQKPPYGFVDTRWSRRAADDLPQDLLAFFDLAASSPSMEPVTKKRIIDGLFMDPLKRAELRDSTSDNPYYGNECPLKAIAERALVLEDPERVHIAYNLIRKVPQYATSMDGLFNQSLVYSSIFRLTFFEGARILDGYSDPQGFVGKDGLHLQNIYPLKEMEEYFYRLATGSDLLRLPSGGWLTYDDSGSGFGPTWWSGVPNETCRALSQSSNVLLPGLRRAVLGAGSGDKQIQVALDFAEHGVGHGHASGLVMQIYAFGHSLIDDFPYHKSVLRSYGSQTVSHPTVVIDYKRQMGKHTSGDVELYAPLMDGVAAIRVDDKRAYADRATTYTRTLVLNSIDPDMPYIVDIFEVAGGTTHDYLMRSSGLHHSSASSSLSTQALSGERALLPPGEEWKEPKLWGGAIGSGYGLFFDAGKAPITGPFHFTSACDKPWETPAVAESQNQNGLVGPYLATPASWSDRPAIGIRHHVAITKDGYEFLDFTSPSLVEMGFHGKEDVSTEKWPRIPHRILRHAVKEGGESLFVVVHEPYYHAPKITAVTRLDTGDDKLVALRIESPGRADTALVALDKRRSLSVGGVTMMGCVGLVSRQEKKPPRAYLIEGTHLTSEGVELKSSVADYSGTILEAQRRWDGKGINRLRVNVNTPLQTGDALRGTWMIVKLGPWKATVTGEKNAKSERSFEGATQAVEIDHVSVEDGNTWIYMKGDHGLLLSENSAKEFYWPCRTFSGKCTFVIPTATTTHPLAMPPRPMPVMIAPLASAPAGLKTGVKITRFSGTSHDVKQLQKISEERRSKMDAGQLEAIVATMPLPGAIRVEGILQVPADGIYRVYFGASDEFRLSVGGEPVIESFRGASLMPETREVKLAKGWYPVIFDCFRIGTSRVPVWATTDWEGPGLERQDALPLLHF